MVLSSDFKMIRELPPDIAKIAKIELNETPKTTKDDIQHLKEWLSEQPHLKARSDDQWLVALLRGCKFNLDKVKQKIDLFYTLRATAPDVVLRYKPTDDKFLDFFKKGTVLVLQKPNMLYPRVILIRAGAYDPAVNHVLDIMCMLYYLVQILIVDDDVASVVGTNILVDYEGVGMRHIIQATPSVVKKMIAVSLLRGRNNEVDIPSEILPKDYGGKGQSVKELTDYWVLKFQEYRTWMEQEMTFGTDESKRLRGKAKDFRILNID